MNLRSLNLWLPALAVLAAGSVAAQTAPEEIAANPERSAGVYHSYEYLPSEEVPVPKGYHPFYISHYGRHGSRYHYAEELYTAPLVPLRAAAAADALTPLGRTVLAKGEALAADAVGRYGDLTPRGVEEHRAIAERMFRSWPEVFSTRHGRECLVESRSTLVPRCILSMAAFNERLKELNPRIRTTRESSARYMDYLASVPAMGELGPRSHAVADSVKRAWLHPERLVASLFTEAAPELADPQGFMYDLFMLTSIAQDVSRPDLAFYDAFTSEELNALWATLNAYCYYTMGPSSRFGDPIVASARPLLRNIVETAREVIDGERNLAASLRFGHDVYLIPLASLLQASVSAARISDADSIRSCWSIEKVSPMAANIQFIFFRHERTGNVRVRVLCNERDALLPIDGGPYYPWETFRSYCEGLCAE